MKNKNVILSALALSIAGAFSGAAFAQPGMSCDEAVTILSNSTVNGDTCNGGAANNPIGGFGPLPSPHNDYIYSFVAEGADATINVPAASYDYGVFLTTNCAGTTAAPMQAVTGPGVGGSFPVSGLQDGTTYYIIVSGNPSVDTPACGTYTIDVDGQLPVELQNFSVE
jgi:hypothetical protein